MKIAVLNTSTVKLETVAEQDSIAILTGKMKLHITENENGSLELQTMAVGGFGDNCVILLDSGNTFTLNVKGNT